MASRNGTESLMNNNNSMPGSFTLASDLSTQVKGLSGFQEPNLQIFLWGPSSDTILPFFLLSSSLQIIWNLCRQWTIFLPKLWQTVIDSLTTLDSFFCLIECYESMCWRRRRWIWTRSIVIMYQHHNWQSYNGKTRGANENDCTETFSFLPAQLSKRHTC